MSLPQTVNLNIIKGDSFSQTFTIYAHTGLRNRGTWSNLLSYAENDLVVWGGAVYYCIAAHTGFEPPNVTYWGTPTPLDLSTATILSKIKSKLADSTALLSFTVALVTDGTDGKFTISLTYAQTAALTVSKAVYDVEVTIGTERKKYIKGQIDFDYEATV